MLQRLGIAQALIHEPDLLLIDEPTSGLDPAGQREVIDLLLELRRRGHTILMCSHQLPEVERLCDRVGVLNGHRLAAEAVVRDLAATGGVRIVPRSGKLPDAVVSGLRSLGPAVQVDGREARIGNDEALQSRALRLMLDAGVAIGEVAPVATGVEEMYIKATRGAGRSPSGARLEAEQKPQVSRPAQEEMA
jgi:ABC-2 type transport system ATP-binding protein